MAEIPENQEITLEDSEFRSKGNNGTNGSATSTAAALRGIVGAVIPRAALRIVGLGRLGPIAGGVFAKA